MAWKRSVPWLPFGHTGLTLGRIVLYVPQRLARKSLRDRNRFWEHELEHTRQFRKYGFFRFLYLYTRNYLRLRRRGFNHRQAYRGNAFEAQARAVARQKYPF